MDKRAKLVALLRAASRVKRLMNVAVGQPKKIESAPRSYQFVHGSTVRTGRKFGPLAADAWRWHRTARSAAPNQIQTISSCIAGACGDALATEDMAQC